MRLVINEGRAIPIINARLQYNISKTDVQIAPMRFLVTIQDETESIFDEIIEIFSSPITKLEVFNGENNLIYSTTKYIKLNSIYQNFSDINDIQIINVDFIQES